MKIKYKLIFSSLIIVAIFLLAGYFINSEVINMGHAQDDLITAMRIEVASKEYINGARSLQAGVYLFVQGEKDRGNQLIKEGNDRMSENRKNLRKLLSDPDMLGFLSEAERREEKVVEASNSVLNNIDNEALTKQNLNTLQTRVNSLELQLKDIDESAAKHSEEAVAKATMHSQNTIQTTYIGIIGALMIALIISFVMASIVTNPIRTLTDVANRVSKGDIGANVSVTSNDEIGELAESFKRMVNAFRIMDALSREK